MTVFAIVFWTAYAAAWMTCARLLYWRWRGTGGWAGTDCPNHGSRGYRRGYGSECCFNNRPMSSAAACAAAMCAAIVWWGVLLVCAVRYRPRPTPIEQADALAKRKADRDALTMLEAKLP